MFYLLFLRLRKSDPKKPIMSFKIFIASTFGLIKSTAKLEAAHNSLLVDYQQFTAFAKSGELQEFEELELLVKSAAFLQKKKELQHLVFKGSKEEAQLKELKKLEQNSSIQKFFATEKSVELKRFEKIVGSGSIEKFQTLKKYVSGIEFQQEKSLAKSRGKKKFETTEAFAKQQEYLKLKSSDDLKFFQKFQKSGLYRNYEKLKGSSELKRYEELTKMGGSSGKGNLDEQQSAELKKLEKNTPLQKFLATQKSAELKRFRNIAESGMPDKYSVLKMFVEGNEFQNAKKKAEAEGKKEFETTAAFAKLQEFTQLQNSDDLKFYLGFAKSSAYKNYLNRKDSAELKRLEELQKITATVEFKNRVTYLEDSKKWEKMEESAKEKRFLEMKKLPQVLNYLQYKNSSAFDFFKKWELVFEDRFETGKLDTEKWLTKSYWVQETLGQNFSQMGDLQAFSEGKNIFLDGKSLKIEVRKEKTKGMQWQIPFGFVEQEFDYSSAIVSTAGTDWWNHGILEAKVRYSPCSQVVDAMYLLGEESSPQINLLEMGAKNRLGTLTKKEDGVFADCASISGLKSGEFYIFRLEWSSNSLIWKINNKEILTINLHVPSHNMHLNAASIVVSEPIDHLPHRFEIDWVRFYQHAKV